MLLRLAWWTVRFRKVSFAGSYVAMVCAQALVTACAVLLESGSRAGAGDGGPDVVSFAVPFGFICLFVAAFAVAGTFSLSVRQRLREIALLRAIAATPGQIRRLVAYEALVVTVAAAPPGCGLGVLLALAMRAQLTSQGMLPGSFSLDFGPVSLLSAVGVCWATAEAAVWAGGRRAARVQAIEALGEAVVPRRRLGVVRAAAGLAVLGGGLWGLAAIADSRGSDQTNTATSMVMVLLVAVALLGPWIGRLAGAVCGLLCRVLFPTVGLLVRANLRTGHHRLAAAVTPLALTVAFAAVALFVPDMKWHELQRQDQGRLVADHLVRVPGKEVPSGIAENGPVADVARLPGTGTAVGVTGTFVDVIAGSGARHPGAVTQAVSGGRLDRVLDLGAQDGGLPELGAHDVALSTGLAHQVGVQVGDGLQLEMEDDSVQQVRVVGLYTRSRGFGDVLVPERLAAPHLDREWPDDVMVYVRSLPGEDGMVAHGLAALRTEHPGWQVQDRAAHRAEAREAQNRSMTATYLLLGVVTLFTSISVVNTLVMTTMERSREFALLRLVGATRRQVVRMMRLEHLVTVAAALAVGAAVAAAVLVAAAKALTGSADPYLPASTTFLILAGAGALALATGVTVTRIALRQRPEDALRGAE
ncbi:FtsX-like permease family protein [Streptomyces sp. NPDC001262]|uniref:FtsX-like permease family protein n=1 Tax=unclassified Streptomyces TaxID=2593676 RepID=UPI0036784EC5